MQSKRFLVTGGVAALLGLAGFALEPLGAGRVANDIRRLLSAGEADDGARAPVEGGLPGGGTDALEDIALGPDAGFWELAAEFNATQAPAFVSFLRFQHFLDGLTFIEARFGPRGAELGKSPVEDLIILQEARKRLGATLALSSAPDGGFFGKVAFAVLLSRAQRQLGYYGSGRLDDASSALLADIGAAFAAGVSLDKLLPSVGTPSANPVGPNTAWRQRPKLAAELHDGVNRPERADLDLALPWLTYGEESDRLRTTAYDDADDRAGKAWNRIEGDQTIAFGVDIDQDFPREGKVTANGTPWRRGLEGPFYIPDADHAPNGVAPTPGNTVRQIMDRAGVDVARWNDLRLGRDTIDVDDAYALTVAEMIEKRNTLSLGRGSAKALQLKNFERLPTHVRAVLIELAYYRGDGFLRNNPRLKAALEQEQPDYRAAARAMLVATGIDHGTRRIVWFVAAFEAAAKGVDPGALRSPKEFYARLENPALMDYRPVVGADDDWPVTARAIKPYLAGLTARDAKRAASGRRKPINYYNLYRTSLDRFIARPGNTEHPEMSGIRARRAAVFEDSQGQVDPGLQCIPNSALGVVPETDNTRIPYEWAEDGCRLYYVAEEGWRVPCTSTTVTRHPYAGVENLVQLSGEPPISASDACRVTWRPGVRTVVGGSGDGTAGDGGGDDATRNRASLDDWLAFLQSNLPLIGGGSGGGGSGSDGSGDDSGGKADGWQVDTVGAGSRRPDLPRNVQLYQVTWTNRDGSTGSSSCAIDDGVRYATWDVLRSWIEVNCPRPRQT
jgi:hypothetical protein